MICGFVFMYILSSLPFLLRIDGVSSNTITLLSCLCNIPYATRIFASIPIKFLLGSTKNSIKLIKILLPLVQTIASLLVCIVCFARNRYIVFPAAILSTTIITIQDILLEYVRLELLPKSTTATSTTVGTIGHKIGQLTGGAIAILIGQHYSLYFVFIACVVNGIILQYIDDRDEYLNNCIRDSNKLSKKITYSELFRMFLSANFIIIITFLILYKSTDSFTHTLKPNILTIKGFVGKNVFAINSQINSFICAILSGVVICMFSNKINTPKRITKFTYISSILQIIPAICWYLIARYTLPVPLTTILISVSSIVFCVSSNSLRMFLSHLSNKNVNKYIFFMSLGSIARVICSCMCYLCCITSLDYHIMFIAAIIFNLLASTMLLRFFCSDNNKTTFL